MRPYLAILTDAFHEALVSRVLWVVLVLIVGFLLTLVPLGVSETLTVGFEEHDVPDWPRFVEAVKAGGSPLATKPVRRLWEQLPGDAQAAFAGFQPLPKQPQFRDVRAFQEQLSLMCGGLQQLIARTDFYDASAHGGMRLRVEGRDLVRRLKELTPRERERLNRLLVEATFVDLVDASPGTSLQMYYSLYGEVGPPIPVSRAQFTRVFNQLLVRIVDWGIAIGLLVSIIITAPIIPQTFEPGSLHLLLSKPVWRTLLFLTKFLGGCAYVLLCVCLLFFGLYLVLGWRLQVWELRLLWCIPLYTFVFAVYYSVSALAALIWRNTILCIALPTLFWALCFAVGVSKLTIGAMEERAKIQRVVPAGDEWLMVDGSNTPYRWDASARRWQVCFLPRETKDLQPLITALGSLPPITGPVYDAERERVLGVMVSLANGQRVLGSGAAERKFEFVEGPAAPYTPLALLTDPQGQPLLATGGGLYRLRGELAANPQEFKILGYKLPFGVSGPFQEAGPTPTEVWNDPFAAAFAPDGLLYVYSRGKLQALRPQGEKFVVSKSVVVEGAGRRGVRLAAGRQSLWLALRDGRVIRFERDSLARRETTTPVAGQRVLRFASSPPGDHTLAVCSDGQLLRLDDAAAVVASYALPSGAGLGQGDIATAAFAPGGDLLLVDRVNRLTRYDAATGKINAQLTPPLDFTIWAYRYVMYPIYYLFPKPGEISKTASYLLTEEPAANESVDEPGPPEDNGPGPLTVDRPWDPLYSSGAFLLVMLALGCLYIHWQEF